jgi:lysozyme family protein
MTDPFDTALAFAWRPENDGQGFHNDPRDPGGATTWGVTFGTWSGWQRMHGAVPTLAAFQALGPDDLRPLYRALFWNACRCDSLHPAVALVVFDAAVGSAPAHAARFLQSVLHVAQDGAIGPVTLAAAAQQPPAHLVNALTLARESFYAGLAAFRIYGNGWDRRAEDCRRLALSMCAEPDHPAAHAATQETTTPWT